MGHEKFALGHLRLALDIILGPRHLPLSVQSTKSEKQERAKAMTFASVKKQCPIVLSLIILLCPVCLRSQTMQRTANMNTADSESAPDIASLLAELQSNQKAIEEVRENYTYTKLEEEIELDGRGQVRSKHAQEYEVFYVNGNEIQKLVARDGKSLSPSELQKEQGRVQKQVLQYTSANPKPASRREEQEEDELHISTFLRAAKFTNLRQEIFRGQDVLAMDIEPNPGYHPRNLDERLVQKLEGIMWIDRRAHQVVRLQAHLSSTAKIAAGLLGSVGQGSAAVFEQSLINNEVWLPSYLEEHLSGRFLLLKNYRSDLVIHYQGYKKYRVEVRGEIGSPKPN
jgi:hypothetical protein